MYKKIKEKCHECSIEQYILRLCKIQNRKYQAYKKTANSKKIDKIFSTKHDLPFVLVSKSINKIFYKASKAPMIFNIKHFSFQPINQIIHDSLEL